MENIATYEEEFDPIHFQKLKEKIEFFNFMTTSGNPNNLLGNLIVESQDFALEIKNKYENEIIQKITLCKENMIESSQIFTLIQKKILEEISKIYFNIESLIQLKKNDLKEMQDFYEIFIKVCTEQNHIKVTYKHLITYEELISTIMSDEEISRMKFFYEKYNYVKDLATKYNQHLNEQFQLQVIDKTQEIINNFENTLTENKTNIKNLCLQSIGLNVEEYDNIINKENFNSNDIYLLEKKK
jgi:hypothetical protein